MKKTIFVLAACLLASTAALAQPGPRHGAGPGPRYERPHHRPHKVWVPAHREHGRMVRGHYVWR
ncbi:MULTISPECIES: hypothetical protein [unclassified Variovorax]|uniref:hypothetical protein n=1 Tax=unclassified Variovorax TaxID=663243 RepID=UPI003F44BA85